MQEEDAHQRAVADPLPAEEDPGQRGPHQGNAAQHAQEQAGDDPGALVPDELVPGEAHEAPEDEQEHPGDPGVVAAEQVAVGEPVAEQVQQDRNDEAVRRVAVDAADDPAVGHPFGDVANGGERAPQARLIVEEEEDAREHEDEQEQVGQPAGVVQRVVVGRIDFVDEHVQAQRAPQQRRHEPAVAAAG